MNHDQATPPRFLIGIAAFAFSALTIAATVVLPAKVNATSLDAGTIASTCGPATLLAATPDFRLRLDVVGVRQPDVAAALATEPRAKRDRQG